MTRHGSKYYSFIENRPNVCKTPAMVEAALEIRNGITYQVRDLIKLRIMEGLFGE